DRPDLKYDLDTFVRQLDELLDSLRIDQPVHLGGLSFGAAIVTEFTAKHPGRVRSLIYVDPVFNTGRQLRKEERSPLAWTWYNVFNGGSEAMAQSQLDDFLHPERQPDWVARYKVGQQWKGTRESLRRTRAQVAVAPHQGDLVRQIGTDPRPVLIVWGRQDSGAPFSESTALLAAMPHATLVPVDSAGHLPHIEQPRIVVPAVARFLRG
ncbi:MAG TPA: alpha/beta hydrolase, partial [Gemmatimonadales bacterium]|nr:alpha/beta hydrolase [Gemmatimonadales bacterium]